MRDRPLAYLETKRPPKTDAALASSIIQHWQSRHMYGKALVITSSPQAIAKQASKRWGSLMQTLQHERAHTADADKLLTLTHRITRMQQVVITAEPPFEYPAAHLWCTTPGQAEKADLPRTCKSIYIGTELSSKQRQHLYEILIPHTLVIDYTNQSGWNLVSKSVLEEKVHQAWQELSTFLARYEISPAELVNEQNNIDSIDDALDTLLDNSGAFLRHARQFQEVYHLAQPLQLSHSLRKQYNLANMLARRVAMLTPGLLHHSFIQAENDTFSLYDHILPTKYSHESVRQAITRHVAAGRTNLARALERAFVNNLLTL